MSVAPHAGIVDFGTFTPPGALAPGIQGEVPAPLVSEVGYILSTSGWVPNAANSLKSTTTNVNVSAATAPTIGQVLTATSGTAATWQAPSTGTVTLADVIMYDIVLAD